MELFADITRWDMASLTVLFLTLLLLLSAGSLLFIYRDIQTLVSAATQILGGGGGY